MDPGEKQEEYLFQYLRLERRCHHVVEGDLAVRDFLGMKGRHGCADALGLHRASQAAGSRRVTVAESKGNDIASAVEQLGNAAAGVFEKFGRETKVDLLLMVPSLLERSSGALSPGPGYRVDPLKTGRNKFTLQESMGGPITDAQPRVTYPDWMKWDRNISLLRIIVLVLNAPDPAS